MIRRDISILLALLAAFSGCTCTDLAGPDAQLRQAAKRLEQLQELGPLSVQRLQLTRITPEPELSPPRVVFSFDLDGRVKLDDIAVSALGVERVPMQRTSEGWRPLGPALPALAAALEVLRARVRAGAPRPSRWLIRVDVGKVEVTEERADGSRKGLVLSAAPDGGFAEAE